MKIYLDTIGCRLNQSEIESYARQFRAAGHLLVADPAQADLAVINTCTVTAPAAADSRKKIRAMQRAGVAQIAVTGCWSTLNPQLAAGLPGVSHVIPNRQKDELVSEILGLTQEQFEFEPLARQPIPGSRLRTRAFIKAQDGCDNRCTFCITTVARGQGRSRPVAEILQDIHSALQGDSQEIVLTGVHLGSWGQDLDQPAGIRDLVEAILRQDDQHWQALARLRLSSLEPWDLDEGFFSLWSDARLARHLHLPLQSGSLATLRRMARKTTPESFAQLIHAARAAIPGVAITTDIIVGFPGESDAEFEQSRSFVDQMAFAGGHVFTYSARPGTAAARMPGQIPVQLRKSRNASMRTTIEQLSHAYQRQFLGQELAVLWESTSLMEPGQWEMSGLSDNYLRVTARAQRELWNQITKVRLTGIGSEGLYGQVV
ncbi:MAG: MiaB/RimO family radical SAM methylthiotransferase [Anaerolineales bacterium]|nr:MiaB/RimO family radical SAM methylthiotransferase [Anaerolineales bacterium]